LALNIDSVVFDMDGTLINLGGHVEWLKAQAEITEAYAAHGCNPLDLKACSSKGLFEMMDEMWETNIRQFNSRKANDIQTEVYNILHKYEMKGVPNCSLMPGCLDALGWLEQHGMPLGVCTANVHATAESALRKLDLRRYFKAVVGRSTAYKMKPSPDQLEACYKQLDVEPDNSVYVGDSHRDVLTGKALGSYTIAVPMYFTRLEKVKEAGADIIISSLSELPQALIEIKTIGR
jgi:HAD superfamily hydrolase (TIGR01509 family)